MVERMVVPKAETMVVPMVRRKVGKRVAWTADPLVGQTVVQRAALKVVPMAACLADKMVDLRAE